MPNKTILSVNAGSSSVKVTFYTFEKNPKTIANAEVSGITAPPPKLKYIHGTTERKEKVDQPISTPQDAFKFLLQHCFSDPQLSEVTSSDDLACICHRVVHGGDYKTSTVITDETYHHLEELEDLAPLHNFSALEIIRVCKQEMPTVKSVTFFDSAFHQTMPECVRTYPIDQRIAREKRLQKYGFHGISYSFIIRTVAKFLDKPPEKTSIIALHAGSGASICAIRDGKSLDTSMGLTPLAGLPGATRSGSIDPSLVFHYTSDAGKRTPGSTRNMHISTAEEILNKQSGWKALTGTTDFSQIAVPNPPSAAHKLAFDIVVDRIVGFVGNYFVKLDGAVDAIVFAGGIGERSAMLRKAVVEKARCLGVPPVDEEANEKGFGGGDGNEEGNVVDISGSGDGGGPKVLVCQTDEQFEMAYNCVQTYGDKK